MNHARARHVSPARTATGDRTEGTDVTTKRFGVAARVRRLALLTALASATTAVLITPAVARPGTLAHRTAHHTKVETRSGKLGVHLTNAHGRTLYMFAADTRHRSHCRGTCATYWPPLITGGAPIAGGAAKAAKLSTIQRRDGSRQVTYAGHPLYLYLGDTKAGQTDGQGSLAFGARWWMLAPSGKVIKKTG
jgi:predicted lipoprotein with Yx(FWY)xxD motif